MGVVGEREREVLQGLAESQQGTGRAADVEYGALSLVGGAEEDVLSAGVDIDSLGDGLVVRHPVAVDGRVAVVDSRVDQADPASGVRDQERVVISLAVVVGRDTVILNYWGVGEF